DYSFPPDKVKPWGPIEGICSGPEECREAVRYQMKWGADLIKIAASGGVLSEADPVDVPQLTLEEMSAIVSEAHKWRRKVAAHCTMFKAALRIGVPIALGTDAGVYPHGMNAMEFGLMAALGMSPAAALLAGTRESAKLLGIEAEVGTLEAGKVADVVAVPGSVLGDIRATEHPMFVMHLGHIVLQKAGT